MRSLVAHSMPMTANKLVASGAYFFESILIIQSLALAGIGAQQSTALYGILQGMIIPILVLPNALTYSLSLSLIPAIAEAHAQGLQRKIALRIHQSLKICMVIGIPFSIIAFLFAAPLCDLMYGDPEIAFMLQWMAPLAVFLYVQAPLQASLQALNRSGTALRNTLFAALTKLALIYILASSPQLGIKGALIAINLNIFLTTLLHWLSVRKVTQLRTRDLQVGRFTVCALFMIALALLAERTFANMAGDWRGVLAPLLALACYVCFLFAFRIVSVKQLRSIWTWRL